MISSISRQPVLVRSVRIFSRQWTLRLRLTRNWFDWGAKVVRIIANNAILCSSWIHCNHRLSIYRGLDFWIRLCWERESQLMRCSLRVGSWRCCSRWVSKIGFFLGRSPWIWPIRLGNTKGRITSTSRLLSILVRRKSNSSRTILSIKLQGCSTGQLLWSWRIRSRSWSCLRISLITCLTSQRLRSTTWRIFSTSRCFPSWQARSSTPTSKLLNISGTRSAPGRALNWQKCLCPSGRKGTTVLRNWRRG